MFVLVLLILRMGLSHTLTYTGAVIFTLHAHEKKKIDKLSFISLSHVNLSRRQHVAVETSLISHWLAMSGP